MATSVGEEGLDIGEVDLIVCYDAQKTPIRMVGLRDSYVKLCMLIFNSCNVSDGRAVSAKATYMCCLPKAEKT